MLSIDAIKQLEESGWVLFNMRGEHYQYRSPSGEKKVTLPHPRSCVPEIIMESLDEEGMAGTL